MLQAVIPAHDCDTTFTVVHLGVRPSSRAAQLPLLHALVEANADAPHVLLGDFNEWHSWNRTFQMLRQRFSCGPALPSFPAMAPALALDRIWFSAGYRLLSVRVENHRLARAASDHLPVVALLET